MKQLNDVKTVDMLPNGAPAFDLDVERDDAWPMPAGGVWVPRPAAEPELTLAQRIGLVWDRVLG